MRDAHHHTPATPSDNPFFRSIHRQAEAVLPTPTPASSSIRHPRRIGVIVACFGVLTALIVWRLLDYTIINWGRAVEAGGAARGSPVRGVIVDRDGELLAADRIFYQVSATPNQIETDAERLAVAQTLEMLIGLPAVETQTALLEAADRGFVQLARTVSYAEAQTIRDWKEAASTARSSDSNTADAGVSQNPLQYVHLTPNPQRYYPQGALLSQVLGFASVNTERQAHYGVEEYYDLFLQQDGVGLTAKSDKTLDALTLPVHTYVPSAAGKDLVLTIDRTIQWIIEDELRQNIDFYRASSGSIIVMEPQTGAVLGLANWPTFDPNAYSQANVDHFDNPAVSAQYEPGSIFKVITMAAALDTGAIEPYSEFVDEGSIAVGGRIFFNSDRSAAGTVNATQTLARSLNVVTVQIATRVGAEDFYRYVRRFGFGEASEIDLADEVPGLLKTPGTRDWSPSDLGTNSFGQGLAVTPIQMLSAVTAIANGGKLMRPYVVRERISNGRVLTTEPTVVRSVIQPETATKLTQMMVDVVETGTPGARVTGYYVAGKSGTAQIPVEGGYAEDETIASFVGFLPAYDPQFVILVKLDRPDPDISPWAAYTAAPVFSRVAHRILDHVNMLPSNGKRVVSP